jgi:hypothetical protein
VTGIGSASLVSLAEAREEAGRIIGSQGSGVINARPILGRSFRFSVGYKF